MVSRTIRCESLSNMGERFSSARVECKPHCNAGENESEQPALERHPQRAARQRSGDRAGGKHEAKIRKRANGDLDETQHEALSEHIAARGIDELGKQRQIEDRHLRVQDAGQKPHTEKRRRRVGRQDVRCKNAPSARLYHAPCQPKQTSSMPTAVASPPPMQRVATPRFPPVLRKAPSSVAMIRAPDAPIGWPSAHAPPCTFTLSAGKSCSLIAAMVTTAKASLISYRSGSFDDQPTLAKSLRIA